MIQSTKTTTIIATTLLLITLSTQTTLPPLSQQISSCYAYGNKRCKTCFQSEPSLKNPGCGPQIKQTNCSLFTINPKNSNIYCDTCKEGFELFSSRVKGGKITWKCKPSTLQTCVSEVFFFGKNFCLACDGGYPSQDFQKCIPASEFKTPVKNCLWGSLDPHNKFYGCLRCKPGFTYNGAELKCVKTVEPGCLDYDFMFKSCNFCDVYDGYSQQADKKCVKVAAGEAGLVDA